MVEQHLCSFCGEQIEPGTGKMYVKKDGTVFLFCTNKCYKNMVDMKRVPRNITWTKAYAVKKGISAAAKEKAEQKAEPKEEVEKAAPKVKAPKKTKAKAKPKAEAVAKE